MGADDTAALRGEVERAVRELAEAGVPSARPDAMALAEHVLGVSRLVLAAPPPVPAEFAERYRQVVARRAGREPLQHIIGSSQFRHVRLQVRPGVFVPRPETEVVAGAAIDAARRLATPTVIDLCCGTGAIAAAVADEVPGARVVAVDIDPAAVALARDNLGGTHAVVVQGDVSDGELLADLDGTVDVVVSNPPYIPPDGVPIDPEVRDHDPARALYGGGADGLDLPRAVVAVAARLLRPGGVLIMEHGDRQAERVRALLGGEFEDVVTRRDLTDRDRFVLARHR